MTWIELDKNILNFTDFVFFHVPFLISIEAMANLVSVAVPEVLVLKIGPELMKMV
jgi:hypothetical protein